MNRANWDERTSVHLGPGGYDLSTHRAGAGRLDSIVSAGLGSVAGLRVLHLQCHIGHDTVALVQAGAAMVVGVDFSTPAIAAARALAAEVGAGAAHFVLSDVYDAPRVLPGEAGGFDLVFTTWGTICWLPDLPGWARVAAHFLRPGGSLFFADAHPTALVFGQSVVPGDEEGRPGWDVPYFETEPLRLDNASDYADPAARIVNSRTVEWVHRQGAILEALGGAGFRLDWLQEHPRLPWRMFPGLVMGPDGLWTWPRRPWLPLSLSLRAVLDTPR